MHLHEGVTVKQHLRLLPIVLLVVCASMLQADVILVPSQQPTIQAGINAASEGDTVLVAPGVYYENVAFTSDGITLLSQIIHSATIDGGGDGHVVALNNHSGIVDGFVITGSGSGYYRGVFTSHSTQIIRNNIISGNNGGVRISSGSIAEINGNRITNNNNGIQVMTSASALIVNNDIYGNTTGVECWTPGPVQLVNNTIVNHALCSVIFRGTTATVTNNIITNSQYGIWFYGYYDPDITGYVGQFLTISYNDIWENSVYNYYAYLETWPYYISGPFDPLPGAGEIHADPHFVLPDNNEWRLFWSSPCIDTGDPDSLDADGTRSDMGAHYFNQLDYLTLYVTPDVDELPPGGQLGVTYTAINRWEQPEPFWVLSQVTLPGGNTGDVVGPFQYNMSADTTVQVSLIHDIPVNAPTGMYEYWSRIGIPPSTLYDEDSFKFHVKE